MLARLSALSLLALLIAPIAAFGSVADEQRQGAELSAQLHSGAKTCGQLSDEDFDHIGEFVMGRFLGSTQAHEAMNERMRLMMGEQAEQRMHELMGRRYSGCSQGQSSRTGMMGSGMMGGNGGPGGFGPMMRSGDWGWMMNGAWLGMNRADWHRLESHLLGTSSTSGSGWSVWAIVGVGLGAALLAGLAVFVLVRRRFRRPLEPNS